MVGVGGTAVLVTVGGVVAVWVGVVVVATGRMVGISVGDGVSVGASVAVGVAVTAIDTNPNVSISFGTLLSITLCKARKPAMPNIVNTSTNNKIKIGFIRFVCGWRR